MSTPEKCPKCGCGFFHTSKSGIEFDCFTLVLNDGSIYEGAPCLSTQRDQLAERVKQLEAVVTDPHALWSNWLRGDIQLPAGVGDIRECAEKMKRFRSRWLAAHNRMMEMENEAERSSERVKRLEEAGRRLARLHILAVFTYPQALSDVEEYEKAIQ